MSELAALALSSKGGTPPVARHLPRVKARSLRSLCGLDPGPLVAVQLAAYRAGPKNGGQPVRPYGDACRRRVRRGFVPEQPRAGPKPRRYRSGAGRSRPGRQPPRVWPGRDRAGGRRTPD